MSNLGNYIRGRWTYTFKTFTDPNPGLNTHIAYRLEHQKIQQILQTLTEIDRAAFILCVQHDMPYAEIASTLGISISASKVKVHRVRKKLLAKSAE
jgi:RNA polymerase sigma factor (sigma-70 family)